MSFLKELKTLAKELLGIQLTDEELQEIRQEVKEKNPSISNREMQEKLAEYFRNKKKG